MKRRASWTLPALLLPVATLVACQNGGETPAAAPSARGIVLVTIQDWWSEGQSTDPFPENWLPGALRLSDATTVSPQVRPAVTAVLTGQAPDRTRVLDEYRDRLAEDTFFLPAALRDAGWRTAAFVTNPNVGFGSGLERGFETFDAPNDFLFGPFRRIPLLREPSVAARNFSTWVRGLPQDAKFFAWLHLGGVPRTMPSGFGQPPATPDGLTPTDRIAAALREIGATIAEAPASERIAVLAAGVTGPLSATDGLRSGYFLVPEVLRVPAQYRPAAAPPEPGFAGVPLWLPDLAVIAAKEAGLAFPRSDGGGPPGAAGRVRFAWSWQGVADFGWPGEIGAIRDGALVVQPVHDGKLLERIDPPDASAPAESLGALLAERLAGMRDLAPLQAPEEGVARVKAAGLPFPAGERHPPLARNLRAELGPKIHEGRKWAFEAAPRYAAREFDAVVERDPGNAGVLAEAGEILALGGMGKRARETLDRAIRIDPHSAAAWHWLGHVEIADGNLDRAEAVLKLSDSIVGGDPDVLYDLACVQSRKGNLEESEAFLRRAWDAGFRSLSHVQADPDLQKLRADPRFARFMREVVR